MTPQEVSDAWSRYFVRDNRVVGIFIPDDQPRRAQMSPALSLDEVLSKYEFKAEGQKAEVFDSSAANLNAYISALHFAGMDLQNIWYAP